MVKQFLPILFPSWRFFSGIGASPRIELGFVVDHDETPEYWIAFRPIPRHLSVAQHIIRLFHNPRWNELLFINTCAERLFETMDDCPVNNCPINNCHMDEIARRLLAAVLRGEINIPGGKKFLLFRVRAIYSEEAPATMMGNVRDAVFVQSRPYRLSGQGVIE